MPGKRSLKSLTATAYHEAGHAIAHIHNKVSFNNVTIVEGDDSLGCVLGYRRGRKFLERLEIGYPTLRDRDRLEREIVCLLAGHVAERKFLGRKNNVGASHDFRIVYELTSNIEPKECGKYIDWLYERTINMITNPGVWTTVERLAIALLERRTIPYKDVLQILRDAAPKFTGPIFNGRVVNEEEVAGTLLTPLAPAKVRRKGMS